MKKALSSISIIALIVILAGCLFKFMHWPAAGILLALGSAIFIILGVLWLFMKKRDAVSILLGILLIILIASFLWELQQWPGGEVLLWGKIIITFIFATVLFSKKD
jgi:uncharacterized membrane protein YfcA